MPDASSLERKSAEARFFLLYRAFEWLVAQIYLQKHQFFLWTPVFAAFGIGVYFSLPAEPPLIFGVMGLLFISGLYVTFFRGKAGYSEYIFMILILSAGGFVAAQVRTVTVYTPVLVKDIRTTELIGTVFSSEELETESGQKLILGDLEIERLKPEETPRFVRLSYRASPKVIVGQRIKVLAALNAPASPTIPGGFDFRRYMFFQGIGAVGFIYKSAEIVEEGAAGVDVFTFAELVRQSMAERMMAFLPEREAALIIALTIGKQGGISKEDREAMRDAGLAHILAISGMNFALMAGVVFFSLRFALACIPYAALYYPIKKICAVAAIIAAIVYLFLTGFTIPAQRAVLSTIAIFTAVLFDRSPMSLRLASFAALVVLILSPESLLSASFHMSFAAVIALISFYDRTRLHWENIFERRSGNFAGRIVLYFLGVCVTTLIGSVASGVYALFHFQRFSVLGIVANFVAVPIIAFVITPFSLLALLLAPVSLDWVAYEVLGVAAVQILNVAHWVADLPLASVQVSAWNFSALVLFSLAGVWCVLWKGRGKIVAFPLVIAGFVLIGMSEKPVLLIGAEHKIFGFYDGENLYVNSRRADQFTRENWERTLGLPEGAAVALHEGGNGLPYLCDDDACRFDLQGVKISFVKDVYVLERECAEFNFLIVEKAVPDVSEICNERVVIDRYKTAEHGAFAVYKEEYGSGFRTESAAQMIGRRPWSAYNK